MLTINFLLMNKIIFSFFVAIFSLGNLLAQVTVDGKTCEGVWKTIDDETGKAKSHVKVWQDKGVYYGKIVQLLNRPANDLDPNCDVCPGDKKGKKVNGMTIIWGMKKESSRYAQGKILDPKSGKTYDCTMWLEDKNTLKVRGWLAMFYRTQTWSRIE